MKRFLAGVLCATLLISARANDAPPASAKPEPGEAMPLALEILPDRKGYAFDRPEILIRQRLFGRAHGVSLLAAACLDHPEHSGPVQDAYTAWHARQRKAIETIVTDLALYYFGRRANVVQWPDLSRALNLPNRIEPALREITLFAACASLPEALAQPRYELDRMLKEGIESGVEEVPASAVTSPRSGIPGTQSAPAPTIRKDAE